MPAEPIVIEKIFNAPIARVWRAITENDELKNWYFKLAEFKAEVGFKFQFEGGPEDGIKYMHRCEITEVIPGKKLTYSWRYDGKPGNSFVSFELQDMGDKTLLKLTHTGVETFTSGGPDFRKGSFVEGWTYFVHTALKNYLEQ